MKARIGFSLIELMIANVIALIIIITVFNYYVRMRLQDDTLSSINDARSLANKIIRQFEYDTERAGFVGCRRLNQDFINTYRTISINPTNYIEGDKTSLTVRHMGAFVNLIKEATIGERTLSMNDDVIFNVDDIIIIADCEHGEINKVVSAYSRYGKQIISLEVPLKFSYHVDTLVGRYIENHYYFNNHTIYLSHLSGALETFSKNISQFELIYSSDNNANKSRGIWLKFLIDDSPIKKPWYAYFAIAS